MAKQERETPEELRETMEVLMEELDSYVPDDELLINLISNKLVNWKNTIADARLDAKIALHTEDHRMLKAAQARLKNAIKAIEFLDSELDTLNKDEEEDGNQSTEES